MLSRHLKPTLFRAALLAWVVLAATACQHMAPPTPCQAWRASEEAWRLSCEYGAYQLANARAAACLPAPPVEPPPTPAPPPGGAP